MSQQTAVSPIRRVKEPDLRQQITDLLKRNGVISSDFTGKLVLNYHRGGLNSSSREECNPI